MGVRPCGSKYLRTILGWKLARPTVALSRLRACGVRKHLVYHLLARHASDVDEDGNEVILPQDTDSEPETEKPKFSETVEIPLPSLKKLTNVRAELDDNGFRL